MADAALKTTDFTTENSVYEAKTRSEALQSILSGEADSAKHDHVVSPLVHNAAYHIIQNKKTLDVELYGLPYEVLERASSQLAQAGISTKLAHQAMEALEQYIINMGTDFSREAKAKPLYARFKVTDREPDNLPECEQTQATFLDGMKSYGGDSARVIRYLSVFGSKSTSSQGVDMDAMFASKNTGLFVFFGSPANEGVKGFDSVDSALMNVMQGAGGAVSAEGMAEIKEMIQSGDLTPETLSLIENLAVLAQTREAAMTPGAVDKADVKIAALSQNISEQIIQEIETGHVPQVIVAAAVKAISNAMPENMISSVLDHAAVKNILADNDNIAVAVESQITSEQTHELGAQEISDLESDLEIADTVQEKAVLNEELSTLAEEGAPAVAQIIQQLAEAETLPPEIQQLVDSIDIEALTPQAIEQALSAETVNAEVSSDLTQNIQSLIVSLNDPEVQSVLPQETLNHVNYFLNTQPDLVTAVSTNVVIQNFDAVIENIPSENPVKVEVRDISENLKSGEQHLASVDNTVIQAAALHVDRPTFKIVESALSTIATAKTENVSFSAKTVETLQAMPKPVEVKAAAQHEVLQQAVKTNDQNTMHKIIASSPAVIASLPPRQQAVIQKAAEVKAIPRPILQAVAEKGGKTIVPNVLKDTAASAPPVVKATVAVKAAEARPPVGLRGDSPADNIKTAKVTAAKPVEAKVADVKNNDTKTQVDQTSQNKPVPSQPSPVKAETIFLKQEKVDIPVHNKTKEEPSFQTGCAVCGGGNCASCGGDFAKVTKSDVEKVANKTIGLESFSLFDKGTEKSPLIIQEKAETPSFQTGCAVCGGGNCASCGGDFAKVHKGEIEKVVSRTVDLSKFSLSDPKPKAA